MILSILIGFIIILVLMVMVLCIRALYIHREATRIELNCSKIKRPVGKKLKKRKQSTYSWF